MKELSNELSKRISAEEVEAAINKAVRELETELQKALKRAESMRQELEAKEGLLKQLQTEWAAERASLRGEIANVQEQVTEMQVEQEGVRTDFMEAVEKVSFSLAFSSIVGRVDVPQAWLFCFTFVYYHMIFHCQPLQFLTKHRSSADDRTGGHSG